MAWMPGVDHRPTQNHSAGVQRPAQGIVDHTASGSYDGTISWQLNSRGAKAVSSHFIVGKSGQIVQMVDTDMKAWAQGAGNPYWISIEHEGNTEPLTPQQLNADAHIYAWLVQSGIARLSGPTDNPFGVGIVPHAAGGEAWGGHVFCPGERIKAQRVEQYNRTLEILGGAPIPEPKVEPMQKQLFVDEIHPGLDAAHPKCAVLQGDGSIVLGNGANIAKATVHAFNVWCVTSEMPPTWTFMGGEEMRGLDGKVNGFMYEAVDDKGQFHAYHYSFQS